MSRFFSQALPKNKRVEPTLDQLVGKINEQNRNAYEQMTEIRQALVELTSQDGGMMSELYQTLYPSIIGLDNFVSVTESSLKNNFYHEDVLNFSEGERVSATPDMQLLLHTIAQRAAVDESAYQKVTHFIEEAKDAQINFGASFSSTPILS